MTALAVAVVAAVEPKWGVTRLAQVAVRAPYDGAHPAVLRADGWVACDPANAFASAPSALLRGAAQDAAESSGLFARVVGPASSASTKTLLEVTVNRLALDCRGADARLATVALTVRRLFRRVLVCLHGGDDRRAQEIVGR